MIGDLGVTSHIHGDELTMQFDFIGMQKLYLSMARQDAGPLAEALLEKTGKKDERQGAPQSGHGPRSSCTRSPESSALGTLTRRMPFSKAACTRSLSTWVGRVNVRAKVP